MRTRYYLIAMLVMVADHLSKWLVTLKLPNSPIELIPGYLRLSIVYNTGVAFGFFAGDKSVWKPYVLAAMAVAALVVIFLYSKHMPPDRYLLQSALALTMGGILGNFVDRIFRAYVVDFIEFHIHDSFYFPNFNIADSAITIGVALLLIDTVHSPGVETTEPTADSQ